VTFSWKDYADDHQIKEMRLSSEEFLRRFLLHVLPKGFVRIRHYGLLASVNVASKLEQCRRLLKQEAKPAPQRKSWVERVLEWTGQDPRRCPRCQGWLRRQSLSKPASPCPPEPVAASCGAGCHPGEADSS
jgi:hypothetical protein